MKIFMLSWISYSDIAPKAALPQLSSPCLASPYNYVGGSQDYASGKGPDVPCALNMGGKESCCTLPGATTPDERNGVALARLHSDIPSSVTTTNTATTSPSCPSDRSTITYYAIAPYSPRTPIPLKSLGLHTIPICNYSIILHQRQRRLCRSCL